MTVTALAVTNAEHEPVGLLEPWLAAAGVAVSTVPAWDGTPLPGSWREAGEAGARGLIVMGGPQSAYDDRETLQPDSPWLPDVKKLLAEATAAGAPVLAVCLGAQLLAEACGGLVHPGDAGSELGARLVAKRDAAAGDPVFGPLPMTPDVVQWHWDTIAVLPPGATLLASSPTYPNQAFRIGRSYGLQFHIETTPEIVAGWAAHDAGLLGAGESAYGGQPDGTGRVDVPRLLDGIVHVQEQMEATWRPAVERFAGMLSEPTGNG